MYIFDKYVTDDNIFCRLKTKIKYGRWKVF